jgi:hypothetical protein
MAKRNLCPSDGMLEKKAPASESRIPAMSRILISCEPNPRFFIGIVLIE